MKYQFKPIEQWIGEETPAWKRKGSQFRATYDKTLQELEIELDHLKAKNIVFQADIEPDKVRIDGMLRARAAPRSPKIILSFDSIHGPMSYPCDRFDHWEDNLRAIALSLKALRSVDRYGVTRTAEQYKGWARLPAPDSKMDHREAARCVAKYSSDVTWEQIWRQELTAEQLERCFKTARAMSHPDRNSAEFLNVQKAIETLQSA